MELPDDVKIVVYGGLMLFMTLSFVIVFFVQAYRKKQTEFIAEKNLMLERFRSAISSAKLEISEKTMKDISQEIHDNIGQRLTLATMHLRSKKKNTEAVVEVIELALNDLRKLSKSLNSSFLEENGLDLALEREVRLINSAEGIVCKYQSEGDALGLSSEQEIILFRCIQELLSNAIKHAESSIISVELSKNAENLSAEVSDNGIGFTSNMSDGIGMLNIKDRVYALQGKFEMRNNDSGGMTGKIEIPLKEKRTSNEEN